MTAEGLTEEASNYHAPLEPPGLVWLWGWPILPPLLLIQPSLSACVEYRPPQGSLRVGPFAPACLSCYSCWNPGWVIESETVPVRFMMVLVGLLLPLSLSDSGLNLNLGHSLMIKATGARQLLRFAVCVKSGLPVTLLIKPFWGQDLKNSRVSKSLKSPVLKLFIIPCLQSWSETYISHLCT